MSTPSTPNIDPFSMGFGDTVQRSTRRDIVEGIVRPQLVRAPDGKLNNDRLNLELARMQHQLNYLFGQLVLLGLITYDEATTEGEGPPLPPLFESPIADGEIVLWQDTRTQETALQHTLGRVPVGFFPIRKAETVDIYDGDTAWTNDFIYVRATKRNVDYVYLWVF